MSIETAIKLIFDESCRGDVIKLWIKNISREIDYSIIVGEIQIRLKASLRAEWDMDTPYVLFLQGSAREFDEDFVEIPRKYFKYFLFAVWQYNKSVANVCDLDMLWLDKYKFKCKNCGGIKSVRQFDQINFEYCVNCKDELKICKDCGRLGAEHLFGAGYYCNNCVCVDAYCQVCETEHVITRSQSLEYRDYHGEIKYAQICTKCWDKEIVMAPEQHYQYKPLEFNFLDYDFKKNQIIRYESPLNNVLYMGTEIESQFYSKKHYNIVLGKVLKMNEGKDWELIYAKHDGTVPDPGSEIVTHPMTLNMFRSLTWKEIFDNIVKPSSFEIGGHIHINKNAFISPLHVYKFCKFIRTNVDYIEWIAQRFLQMRWCKNHSKNGKIAKIAKRFKTNRNSDRYEMINFTSNTIELRFFWSPFNTGMLLKNVEFVDALYNFSKDAKLHFSWREFEDFIYKIPIKYPYLYNFILDREKEMSFEPNVEQCAIEVKQTETLSRPVDVFVPNTEPMYCCWCDDEIESIPVEEAGGYYHSYCYDDMIADREAEESFDEEVY